VPRVRAQIQDKRWTCAHVLPAVLWPGRRWLRSLLLLYIAVGHWEQPHLGPAVPALSTLSVAGGAESALGCHLRRLEGSLSCHRSSVSLDLLSIPAKPNFSMAPFPKATLWEWTGRREARVWLMEGHGHRSCGCSPLGSMKRKERFPALDQVKLSR